MFNIDLIIDEARKRNASDIHITPGLPVMIRAVGELINLTKERVSIEQMEYTIKQISSKTQQYALTTLEDLDFAYETDDKVRIRVNIFHQRNNRAIAIRILNHYVPTIEELGLPPVIKDLAMKKSGLILVTGPTGSGKSTTLASMIDYINTNRRCHILTLEDPIEYTHNTKKSLVSQRELGTDLISFSKGLKSALREDPDVILVGEMRDYETISLAITAAETGHLVLSTLHTQSASQTVSRIIDVFPQGQQNQVRTQLSNVLQAVISQQLLPSTLVNQRCAALEIMIKNDAIANLIRDDSSHQIETIMVTRSSRGMQIMDLALAKLVNENRVSFETALEYANNRQNFQQYVERIAR